jgi:hypothetical protein
MFRMRSNTSGLQSKNHRISIDVGNAEAGPQHLRDLRLSGALRTVQHNEDHSSVSARVEHVAAQSCRLHKGTFSGTGRASVPTVDWG